MKSSEIKLSAPKHDISLVLVAKKPENWGDCVVLCGGDENAAIQAFNAGWTVKAQSKTRGAIEEAIDPERDGGPMKEKDLLSFAQTTLDDFVYTGPRERKAKKVAKISKAALLEKGLKASDLKGMDKLFELLAAEGLEVVD